MKELNEKPLLSAQLFKIICVLAMFAGSFWLRAGFLPFGVWAPHDDALFIKLANAIASFEWLGPYDALTLAKGAFFPIFVAVTDVSGLPLKWVEHFLLLLAAMFFAHVAERASGSKLVFFAVFGILAFSPLPWMFEGGARVTREPLYQILSLLVLALAALNFLVKDNRKNFGVALGIAAAAFWLTREEGVWLLPALAVLALPWMVRLWRTIQARALIDSVALVRMLIVPVLYFLGVVLLVNTINWVNYGVFRNNELRSSSFIEAYGALVRIQSNNWQRYVVFPADARQLAYSVSPSALELSDYLDGPQGKQWARSSHTYPDPWGCAGRPDMCSTEILSAWMVWAIRDAVATKGYYRSAREADAYYSRLAQEINQACDQGKIPCDGPRNNLVPVWRGHYLADTMMASVKVMQTLLSLNQGNVGIPPSVMADQQAQVFKETINQNLSGPQDDEKVLGGLRKQLTQGISNIYASLSATLFYCATGVYLLLLWVSVQVKSPALPAGAMFILSALLAAIISRVVLLGFLEATSIPSNNLQYLIPVVPIYLAYVAMSISLGVLVATERIRHLVGAEN